MPETQSSTPFSHCQALLQWLQRDLQALAVNAKAPAPAIPAVLTSGLLNDAGAEGVLPWLAWRVLSSQSEQEKAQLEAETLETLNTALRQATSEKLLGDDEWTRISAAFHNAGIPLLVFKGEALARTLYPAPACRPTADLDALVAQHDIAASQTLLSELGYAPAFPFQGVHMLAEQEWTRATSAGGNAFLIDLHWDISNRRYLRRRVSFGVLWDSAQPLADENTALRGPAHGHALLLACLHLAGALDSEKVQLKWLLDIHLLLEALDGSDFEQTVQQARAWGVNGPLLRFCAMTEQYLGPSRHATSILSLHEYEGTQGQRGLAFCARHRWFDFAEYALRLGSMAERRDLLSQMRRYRRAH